MRLPNQSRQSNQQNSVKLQEVTEVIIDTAPTMRTCEKEAYTYQIGGRICCARCQAKSKRTQKQCRSPAIKGKSVCKIHGGRSVGPKTRQGRKRCSAAKATHGRETRAIRVKRRQKLAELKVLEQMAKSTGIL